MKQSLSNAYFKSLKNGHLKFFTKLYLLHCGKRDARKKVIREDENGNYVSPFICYQISLFQLAMQLEKEQLANSCMSAQTEMGIFQLQIERKEQAASNTGQNYIATDYKYTDNEQAIAILKAKTKELLLLIDNETKIGQIHKEQLYSMLQAKISTY